MTDRRACHGNRRRPGTGHSDKLRRTEVEIYRQLFASAWELSNRVTSLHHHRFRFRLHLALAHALERFLRRLPDRIYNAYAWHHEDYRVRLGRPYRRRERREREALLRDWQEAVTVHEFHTLMSMLEGSVCHRDEQGLWTYPPVNINAELARIRRETDE